MMTLFTRSTLAFTISLSLFACSEEDVKPIDNEVLQPLPAQPISINTSDAIVNGLQESVLVTSEAGDEQLVNIETFKGITYANAHRFTHSETTALSGDVDATDFADACPQNNSTIQAQSEDCLNLNIWRPADLGSAASLPVYLFIHGGDFETGSGADLLIHGDNVVAQGESDGKPFIAVTFNYRLGLLGSVWVDEEEGGNFGLGDQKRALQWVYDNIGDFGGDKTNVTLMGQGAGAMSVGILQQTETQQPVSGDYFQRAIMQSNPYGFDYRDYDSAKSVASGGLFGYDLTVELADVELDEVLAKQAEMLDPITKLIDWLGSSLTDDNTPMATLMPFAPYIEYKVKSGFSSEKPGYHFTTQPAYSDFTVPTVLGVNSDESNSFGMLPSLTFLIPTVIELIGESKLSNADDAEQVAQQISDWLSESNNVNTLERALSSPSTDSVTRCLLLIGSGTTTEIVECITEEITLPSTAYEAVTKLFFGLGNSEISEELLALTDFYPSQEATLSGAIKNMAQFKQLNNDMLFSGPSRLKAQQASADTSLYHFGYYSSFNVWSYDLDNGVTGTELIALIKSLGCISGACDGSELPFVFNKAFKLNGDSVSASSKDKLLMRKMSRLWFSDALFTNYQYDSASDNVLTIDTEGNLSVELDWDESNGGLDPILRNGRLDGLTDLGLILGYMD